MEPGGKPGRGMLSLPKVGMTYPEGREDPAGWMGAGPRGGGGQRWPPEDGGGQVQPTSVGEGGQSGRGHFLILP